MIEEEARFCIRCGVHLILTDKFGRKRPACPECDWVLFSDPKVAVAAIVCQDNSVLLVQRNNEPNRGKWSLPAGYMDAGENPESAVIRECFEETGLRVRIKEFHKLISGRSHVNGADLLLVYFADVISGSIQPGDDADDAQFFSFEQLPPLAFENMKTLLKKSA